MDEKEWVCVGEYSADDAYDKMEEILKKGAHIYDVEVVQSENGWEVWTVNE